MYIYIYLYTWMSHMHVQCVISSSLILYGLGYDVARSWARANRVVIFFSLTFQVCVFVFCVRLLEFQTGWVVRFLQMVTCNKKTFFRIATSFTYARYFTYSLLISLITITAHHHRTGSRVVHSEFDSDLRWTGIKKGTTLIWTPEVWCSSTHLRDTKENPTLQLLSLWLLYTC